MGDGPELATDSVVLCKIVDNKATYKNSEGSQSMLSSLKNIVNDLHPQWAASTSRERERSEPHAESTHMQGAMGTSRERERTQTHAEANGQQGTRRSDELALVERRRLIASRDRLYAAPEDATQARLMDFRGKFLPQPATGMGRSTARDTHGPGELRGTCVPVQAAAGPGLREKHNIRDGCGPQSAQPASVQARVGSSLVSEAAFDAALASRDPATVQKAFDKFYAFRRRMEMEQDAAIRANVASTFRRLHLPTPATSPTVDEYGFDTSIIKSYSAFLRHKHGLLGDLIRLHRGEDLFDQRPNKHLFVPPADFPNKGRWSHILANGVIPTFRTPLPLQEQPPVNHRSWSEAFPLLIRDVAKGQQVGEYLILEGDLLPLLMASKQVFLSPFGGAPKDGKPLTECARIVHDESFPRNGGMSVNAATSNIPLEIHHDGVTHIARWGLEESARYPDDVVMMTGDVAGAFRHVPFNCWFCGYFSGYIPELDIIVVNLCLPFGWTGSPVHYSIAGQAIKAIHNSRPGFQNLVYCDDHILIGDGRRFETMVSGIALRRAMVTVLGTTACNEKKFTTWQRQCKALGLIFDFDCCTVTMPASKIAKIVGRLLALLDATKVSLRQLRETMGLLRYLGTCIPVAKPFYNRLQAFMCVLEKVSVPLRLQSNQVEDIRWLLALFRSDALQDMSMARLAGAIPPHDCINMDASDAGVCGVWHSQKKFFAMQWDDHEKECIRKFKDRSEMAFSINYRELLGAYFSVVLWCTEWRRVYGKDAHIRMVIDNMSAVAWTDTRNTKHPEAQGALRIMSLLEATNHVFTSAEHIPGEKNVWADLGSRSWDTEDSMLRFKIISTNYEQVAVPEPWRNPLRAWQRFSDGNPWPEIARTSTTDIGTSGDSGAT